MGVKDAAKHLRPSKKQTHTLQIIRRLVQYAYPMDGDSDSHPIVLIDTSIFLVPALSRKETLSQFFILPPVPVTSVANAVEDVCKLLVNNKFRPCLVLDGASYPPKQDTSDKRYSGLPNALQALEDLYQRGADKSEKVTKEEVFECQKKAVSVRPDILYEIVKMARSNGYNLIGAPFEADSQIVSLLNQGIGEFAVTNDSDLPYQGASKTIMRLSQLGKCCLVTKAHVLRTFKTKFSSPRDIKVKDLALFAAMCGNDYVNRLGGHGLAYAETSLMAYVKLSTETERGDFVRQHANKLSEEERKKFYVSLYSWENAPAFCVLPKIQSDSPLQAFIKGSDHFEVRLRPMSNLEIDAPSWEAGLGFCVEETLRRAHSTQCQDVTSHDMFTLKAWSRTGLPLEPVPPLYDNRGNELIPYAVVDFSSRPARLLDASILRTYLCARAINIQFDSHDELVAKVEEVAQLPNVPLPKFLFRGGGGYRSYEVMKPRNTEALVWVRGAEVLQKIRNCIPPISDEWFTAHFGIRNSSRRRCLKHLKGGSFNITDLESTDGLMDKRKPGKDLLVFKATCAPSQKLGGGDLYQLTCVFQRDNANQDYKYADHPLSTCSCYNGHTLDAHKGGLLLLMFVIQQRPGWDFAKCIDMLPESIHSIASIPIFVSYAYPRRTSQEAITQAAIRKETLTAAKIRFEEGVDTTSDSSDDDTSGLSDEDDNSESGDESSGSSLSNEDEDNDVIDTDNIHWANPLMAQRVRDVASGSTVLVCKNVLGWIQEMEASQAITGDPRRMASAQLISECVKIAKARTDERDKKLQLLRLLRIQEMTEEDPEMRRSLLSHYIHMNRQKIERTISLMADVDGTYQSPDFYD